MEKMKVYDKQTAKFIAVLIQNLPDLSSDVMDGWMNNPTGLKEVLIMVLSPPQKNVIHF